MTSPASTGELRPEPRKTLRPEDSRAAAEARAKEILDHGSLEQDGVDEFYVNPNMQPDGWTYEWKRRLVYNAEDPAYQVALSNTGWEPVPAGRHPEFMPSDWKGKTIERKGMVLMQRPQVITNMIKERDRKNAIQPVRDMEAKLSGAGPGQFERANKGDPLVKVSKSYEAMQIPGDGE